MKRVMPEMGCVIDGSHMSNFDFMVAVLRYAADRGFELDQAAMDEDILWLEEYKFGMREHDEATHLDILESLDCTYDEALDYLNEIDLHRGYVWVVDEQSLFREKSDD